MAPSKKRTTQEHAEAPAPKATKTHEDTLREVEALKKQLADTQKKLAEKNLEVKLQEVANQTTRYLRVVPRILTLLMNVPTDRSDELASTVASISASGSSERAYTFSKHLFRQGRGLCNQRMNMARWVFMDDSELSLRCDSHAVLHLGYKPPKKEFVWNTVPRLTNFPGLPRDVTVSMLHNSDNAAVFLQQFGANVINLMLASVCVKESFMDFVEYLTRQSEFDTTTYSATPITDQFMFDYPQLRFCAQVTSSTIFWGHSNCHPKNDSLAIPPFLDTLLPFRIKAIFNRRCAPPPKLSDH